jgi:predicted amidohydrolase
LGALAKRLHVNIVAGLIERDGKTAYNTAVLIGRDGKLAGKYRKVSLPREEVEGGLTPGSEFPVFDLDFGRVGILICWDIQFPEGARRLADLGAEVILLPIWGGTEPLYPARSIENQVYLVTSSYDSTTGIWSPKGELLTEASEEGSIAVAEVDLAAETYWEWLGNLRWRIPRESPPVNESSR